MDVLSNVLQAIRLKGAVFFDVRGAEPIIGQTPPMSLIARDVMPGAEHVIPFHIMLRGTCWAESTQDGHPPVQVHEGDIVIYPHGDGHVLTTNPGDRAEPDLDAYRRPAHLPRPFALKLSEGGPSSVRFVCGYLGCDASPFNPLLDSLPPFLLAARPPEGNHIEVDLIYSALEEAGSNREGGEAVLARLSELLFVRVLRRHIGELSKGSTGWLAGLADRHVSKALQLIHGRPAQDWTLEDLAREAGLSRTVFAEKFAGCIGETPMHYLAKWRMQLASQLLQHTGRPIEQIAEEVGYGSEAAFNRAFKKVIGMPPGSWRRAQR